jgi:hypothetical protein
MNKLRIKQFLYAISPKKELKYFKADIFRQLINIIIKELM